MAVVELWEFREIDTDIDLSGFEVEARDGKVGTVDSVTYDAGAGSIIVDTGPWILGKKVLLPAGMIERIDPDERKIFVNRTREEIKNAPEWDPTGYAEQEYRIALGDYYSRFYG